MKSKTVRIGIMSQDKIRERMLSIAKGTLKPEVDDPKIWFTSMRSLAEVLSDDNRALLHIIEQTNPHSLKELSETTGRKTSNLSRTLKTLSSYGIVELIKESKQVRPVVNAVEFEILAA